MRKRVPDEVLQEIIDNNGCRKGCVEPINELGIVRLALDLQEAREELKKFSVLHERKFQK